MGEAARDSSRRAKWLIAQRAEIDVEPLAMVSAWVQGAKDGVDDAGWGVRIVHGTRLAETIGSLGADRPPTLGADEVERIHRALDAAARGFDRSARLVR